MSCAAQEVWHKEQENRHTGHSSSSCGTARSFSSFGQNSKVLLKGKSSTSWPATAGPTKVSHVGNLCSGTIAILPNICSIWTNTQKENDFRKLSSSCITTLWVHRSSQQKGEFTPIFTWGVVWICWTASVGWVLGFSEGFSPQSSDI